MEIRAKNSENPVSMQQGPGNVIKYCNIYLGHVIRFPLELTNFHQTIKIFTRQIVVV